MSVEIVTAFLRIFSRPREVFVALEKKRFWLLAACMLIALSLAQGLTIGLTMAQGIPSDVKIRIYPWNVVPEQTVQLENTTESDVVLRSQSQVDSEATNVFEMDQNGEIFAPGKALVFTVVVVFWSIVLFTKLVFDTLYFKTVSVILKLEYEVRDWIAFSVWSRIPAMVLTTMAVFVAVLMRGTVSDSNHYQILAFAFWLRLPEERSSFYDTLMYQLDIALIWVVALQTIGFKTWSGKSTIISLTVVLFPVLVLYGLIFYASV